MAMFPVRKFNYQLMPSDVDNSTTLRAAFAGMRGLGLEDDPSTRPDWATERNSPAAAHDASYIKPQVGWYTVGKNGELIPATWWAGSSVTPDKVIWPTTPAGIAAKGAAEKAGSVATTNATVTTPTGTKDPGNIDPAKALADKAAAEKKAAADKKAADDKAAGVDDGKLFGMETGTLLIIGGVAVALFIATRMGK